MTVRKRAAVVAAGFGLIIAAATLAMVPTAARAAATVVTPQPPYPTYTNSQGVFGWPDPNGPPAPSALCNTGGGTQPEQCDREQFQFESGTSPLTDTFSLTVTLHYSNNNTSPDGPNCLDVAIEDAAASTVYAHASCAPDGAQVTDPQVTPGTTYTVEVDGDATNGVATPQPFSYTVSAVASTGAGAPAPTPVPVNPPVFTHEVSVDVQRGDGEPDLAIDPSNTNNMFTATPWGFSTTVSMLWKTQDGGVQWNNLHGAAVTEACPDPAALVLRPDCSRGGGDAEVQLSQPAAAGDPMRVQFEDLNGLDSISCAYSDNGGDTFTDLTSNGTAGAACDEGGTANATNCAQAVQKNPSNPACAVLGTDRQWLQVWPTADQPASGQCGGGVNLAPVACRSSDQLFMTFDTGDQPPSGDAAISSENNGGSWFVQCSTVAGSSCLGGSNGVGSRPGPLVINPSLIQTVSGVNYPTLYEFMGTNSNGTEVNISCDGGQSWTNIPTSNGMAGSTTNDFVAGAMDSSGELYTAYSVANDPNPWRVWFNHSTGAKKVGNCSQPVQADWGSSVALTGPPSGADKVGATPIPGETFAVMPWLSAGAAGRVDLVYYGTTQPVPFSPDNQAASWYLHMAQNINVNGGGGGTWTDAQATETPMHLESICFSGIGCTAQTPPGGDRNLLDFFQVKIDPTGRAIIIFTDDANSAACAPTCTQGIGLISEVQQSGGPSLLTTGNVPPLTSALSQSTDVRQAGVDADITRNEPTNSQLAAIGHNLQGTTVPAADITDLKVCLAHAATCPVHNTSANTVAFLFTLRSLANGPLSAIQTGSGQTQANWLVTWRAGTPTDLWFAQASIDLNGDMTCIAGRPSSVYNDGEPKAAEYIYPSLQDANDKAGTGRSEQVGCSVNAGSTVLNGQAPNTIEIDVPMDAVSGLNPNSELFGLTGWTGNSSAALDSSVCAAGDAVNGVIPPSSPDTCSGTVGFFNNIAETAPMDVQFGTPSSATPESPVVPALAGIGLLMVAGGLLLRRRRPDSLQH